MAVLAMSYAAMLGVKMEDLKTTYTASEIDHLREQLDGNVSQVSSLEEQINSLNEQITELKSSVVQKNSENFGLRRQNNELNSVLDQIDEQMKIDQAIEHLKLTVQALQNPPKELLNVP
jgi:septal ring factor EnvC (AmiA/AmiB activator)